MQSVLLSRRDMDFLLFECLGVDELTKHERFAEHSRETFEALLDLCEQLAARYFATHNKKGDTDEPSFDGEKVTLIPEAKEAWDAFAQADLLGLAMDQRFGGAQLPVAVAQAGFAWFSAANVSTAGYMFLTMASANLLAKFGTDDQIESFLQPMLSGRFSGTMALSETQAGSSLADVMTRAEPQSDGTYRLFGSKMWISGAEHELTENIVNLVLANAVDSEGLCRRRTGAPAVLRQADRHPAQLGFGERAHECRTAAGHLDASGQELAIAVVPGGQ
jgi:alkylation response protein AidB-like acyl-CoA dehydrogenase